ncbi:RNA-dependent RNA polymerase [Caerostris extrusa]|uniref:RNA-dependent RNA polymerase n=1 Tax=Caerostris extrusa TaxID=172846 RepID=A0AAV4VEY9_CAEEX|nr:RNA-dependent RNA polymerase [Caerostris extrusa]
MCYVRRVVITPSKVIFMRPYEHFDNRIIRRFDVEYMLRVSFQDDNFEKLTYAVQYNSNKELITSRVVGDILMSGITIGSRCYEILASSSSQLREHGLWMYAADKNGNTAATIRTWMGDFTSIKNVPKYMARMGQCLSTTEEGVQVCLDVNSEIPDEDFKSRNGRYIFSDGIGIVSKSLADNVRLALKKNRGLEEDEPFSMSLQHSK